MPINETTLLSVFSYQDPILYISTQFKMLKTHDPSLSIRTWAKRYGFEDVNILIQILKNKKAIRLKHAPFFQRAFNLTPSEFQYFSTMILLQSAKSQDEQEYFAELLGSLNPQCNKEKLSTLLVLQKANHFSRWIDTAIVEATRLKQALSKFSNPLQHFSKIFIEELNVVETEHTLQKLMREGIITQTKNGDFKASADRITTRNDMHDDGAQLYYQDVSYLAARASALPLESREFQCFSLAIQHSSLPKLKETIRKLRKELEENGTSKDADSVFQVNLQLFPVTKTTEPLTLSQTSL